LGEKKKAPARLGGNDVPQSKKNELTGGTPLTGKVQKIFAAGHKTKARKSRQKKGGGRK